MLPESGPWQRPVTELRGIGAARARLLARLGLHTVGDVVLHLPRRYKRYITCPRLADVVGREPGEGVVVTGQVVAAGVQRTAGRRHLAVESATLQDASGRLELRWFVPVRGPVPKPRLTAGSTVTVRGTVAMYRGAVFLADAEPCPEPRPNGEEYVVPYYSLTRGISQRTMQATIRAALESAGVEGGPSDGDHALPAPESVGAEDVLLALRLIHMPQTLQQAEHGRRILALRELHELASRQRILQQGPPVSAPWPARDGPLIQRFLSGLPFRPTRAQLRAMAEIRDDMARPRGMRRMLSGDVGTGKSLVIAYALLKAVEAGGQAVLVVPTRILASQHAATLARLYKGLGVRTAQLTGESSSAERTQLLRDVQEGTVDVLVATQAGLDDEVGYKRLLVGVIDEQHRFGVVQRLALERKGPLHTLWVSATPIPHAMARIIYGEVPVSILDERPPGRPGVETRWVTTDRRADVYAFLAREVERGGRAFVVCPTIDGDDEEESPGAVDVWRRLERSRPGGYPVALVHGRLRPAEQERALEEFVSGRCRVLVATSMVEVGVDVPEATVMVVEGADRFGLAQLHQLRGRVGRGTRRGYAVFISDAPTPEARRRLHALRTLEDGFRLAEVDLSLRGPGEFLGLRQSGTPDLRFVDWAKDADLFRLLAGRH